MTTGNIRYLATYAPHTHQSYEQNLSQFLKALETLPHETLCLAPEVALTDFDYENFEQAARFSHTIDKALVKASKHRTVVLTLIEKEHDAFFNVAKVYHKGAVIHTQAKEKLFTLGEELRYFTAPKTPPLRTFTIGDIKVGLLICFELRFIELWRALYGVDIILVPARWGALRTPDFITLNKAIALTHQCYVLASDTQDEACTKAASIITPGAERFENGTALLQLLPFKQKTIKKMRRYLNIGLHHG